MLRILVIDDTRSVHAFLRDLLKSAPVEMVSVMNPIEGLERLSADRGFDLILLDWEMPELDGPSTYAKIREKGVQIPVVMMTTKNAPQDIARMLTAGVSEYLMKPFSWDVFADKLEMVLGKRIDHVA